MKWKADLRRALALVLGPWFRLSQRTTWARSLLRHHLRGSQLNFRVCSQNVVAKPLSQIQQIEQQASSFEQQVIFPDHSHQQCPLDLLPSFKRRWDRSINSSGCQSTAPRCQHRSSSNNHFFRITRNHSARSARTMPLSMAR